MFRWVARQYARRIVNINVNIVVAGLLAVVLTAIPLHLSRYLGVNDDHKTAILVITLVSDWVIDFFVAVGLHWLANHWPRRLKGKELIQKAEEVIESAPPPIPFLKDATTIQLQRACLSPLLYGIALSLQWFLMDEGLAREVAAIVGYSSGILVTRIIHTFWLIRVDRRHLEEWELRRSQRLAGLERKRAESEGERAAELAAQSKQAAARAAAHSTSAARHDSEATRLDERPQRTISPTITTTNIPSAPPQRDGPDNLPSGQVAN